VRDTNLRPLCYVWLLSTVVTCQGKLGELLVSLCYQPTAECITVIVARARELKAKDINGLSGVYTCTFSRIVRARSLLQLDQHVMRW